MSDTRAKARSFLREYKLDRVTLPDLRRILQQQGYTIVEFNHILNDEPVDALIDALGLADAVSKSKGFTYADAHRRLVFLHEDLSEKEKLLVLAHEEGHIYCDHFSSAPVLGKDVTEEHEAGEFTHYLLNSDGKFLSFLRKKKLLLGCIAGGLILAIAGGLVFGALHKEQRYYGTFYITASGNKYHEKECIFVKDKTNTRRMTKEDFESGDFTPCGICLPPEQVTPSGN